tara:strand:- start:668 stop:1174 length:507 start_codon:yes stop_codon:yes gene_type:complete
MELIDAAKNGNIERVREYLDSGADPNFREDSLGNTALIEASWEGNSDIVKLLLDNGADTNIRDNYGDTALMIAKYKDDVEKSKYFNFSKDFSKNYDVVVRLIRNHINLQRARQRLAFATYLLGDDDLDYYVTTRIAKYVNDLDQYGSGRRRSKRRKRKRKYYTQKRSF